MTDAYVSVTDAILGKEVEIETLNGPLKVKVDPGTQHNSKKKLLNIGIYKLPPNQSSRGNHVVTFKVEIPNILTAEQKEALLKYRELETPVRTIVS